MKAAAAVCRIVGVLACVAAARAETIVGFDTLWTGHAVNFEQDSIYELDYLDPADTQSYDFILSFPLCLAKARRRANDACSWLYGMKRSAYLSVVRFQDTNFDNPLNLQDDSTFKPVYATIGDRAADWVCDSPYVCFDHSELVWVITGSWSKPDFFYIVRTKTGNYVVIQSFAEIRYDCTNQPMHCYENLEALIIRWFLQTDGSTKFDVPPTQCMPKGMEGAVIDAPTMRALGLYDCLGRCVADPGPGETKRRGPLPNGLYVAAVDRMSRPVRLILR